MRERDLIASIAARFPRHPDQRNALFACDAEIVPFGGKLLAVSIDEFTEAEDGFGPADPRALGWNLAVATVSDLLAAGATPAWFLHSVTSPPDPSGTFLPEVMRGVAEALEASGCFLIGGDAGAAGAWRYVGCAFGECAGEPLLRTTDLPELLLYATGDFGDGNLAALDPRHAGRFESRRAFAARVRPHARLAMDTSDGLRETLLTLARMNPGHRVEASADAPLHPAAREAARASALPAEAFLVGSAGEYELVVGVAPADAAAFEALSAGEASPIGRMVRAAPDGTGLHWTGGRLRSPRRDAVELPDPRGTPRDEYVRAAVAAAGSLFYESRK